MAHITNPVIQTALNIARNKLTKIEFLAMDTTEQDIEQRIGAELSIISVNISNVADSLGA
jgi:hypothetical protein